MSPGYANLSRKILTEAPNTELQIYSTYGVCLKSKERRRERIPLLKRSGTWYKSILCTITIKRNIILVLNPSLLSFVSSFHPGDRLQRRGRLRGSRPTGWCCNFSRKLSRRRWASHCSRTHSACTTPPSTPCRTCSPGQKTIRWPPSPL